MSTRICHCKRIYLTICLINTDHISVVHVVLYDTIVDADVLEAPVNTVSVHSRVRVDRTLYRKVTGVRKRKHPVGTIELWSI